MGGAGVGVGGGVGGCVRLGLGVGVGLGTGLCGGMECKIESSIHLVKRHAGAIILLTISRPGPPAVSSISAALILAQFDIEIRYHHILNNAAECPRMIIASAMEQRTSEGATVELSADARRRRASLLILIPLTGNNNTITSNTLLAAFSWPVCAGGRVHYGLRVMKSVMMMCLTRAKIDSLEQCASAPITIT